MYAERMILYTIYYTPHIKEDATNRSKFKIKNKKIKRRRKRDHHVTELDISYRFIISHHITSHTSVKDPESWIQS